MKKVSCLGPAGSYSCLAVQKLCKDAAIVPCRNFGEAFQKLLSGEVETAVVPVENSIQGGVLEVLDLLEREKVFAVERLVLPIDHRLAIKAGTSLSQIKKVFSHEQAIGQCSEFLQANLPNADYLPTRSTAESLLMVDDTSAGIVGAHANREGVVLSNENIANEKHNFTQFFRLVKEEKGLPLHGEYLFFCAVCAHKPGSLLDLLRIFADSGLNLTKIESRPIRDVYGEYRFYIEVEGDYADENMQRAIALAKENCRQFRIIGVYGKSKTET